MQFNRLFPKYFSTTVKKVKNNAFTPINKLLSDLPLKDTLLISSQNIKWTASELDAYTTAFAKHLIEVGFKPGNKLFIWSDVNHSAEIITSTIGAWKAGLTVIHSEYENYEEIESSLKEADVFVFSPYSSLNEKPRLDYINSNIHKFSDRYKHIIQISHKTIDGMLKFKQAFNYSTGLSSSINLPLIDSDTIAYEINRPNSEKITLSHHDIFSVNESDKLENSTVVNSAPTFYPSSIGLGFLAQLRNKNYVVYPGSYSLREIVKLIKTQKAQRFICEGNLLDIQFSKVQAEEIKRQTDSVESIYIVGNEKELKNKDQIRLLDCFTNAKIELFDEFSLKRI
jgi:hypothetical protein